MPTPNANLGKEKRISIYIEGSKIGRDFTRMKSFSDKTTFVQGTDSYLGREDERPWQIPTGGEGSFEIDELDAQHADELDLALQDVEATGRQPDVVITKQTFSNSGTVSKIKYVNCTLTPDYGAGGRTEKATRKYSFRSSRPRKG